jgi:hypothetical protein
MIDKTLPAQIKSLEAQLAAVKAQVQRLSTPTAPHSFADLYGILSGKVDSSEGEIDAVHYGFKWGPTGKVVPERRMSWTRTLSCGFWKVTPDRAWLRGMPSSIGPRKS